jgi:hypothetical protein
MDVRPQTSFIPKKSVMPTSGSSLARPSISIFILLSTIIFIITIGLSVGVFFYQRVLVQRIDSMDKRLASSRNAFETGSISEIVRLSNRIESSKEILAKHLLLSPLFKILEDKTLASVRFTSFSYDAQDPSDISVTLKGEAKGFNAVALQSDVFGQEPLFKNPIFSDLNLDENGNIIFRFRSSLDKKFLMYATAVGASSDKSSR